MYLIEIDMLNGINVVLFFVKLKDWIDYLMDGRLKRYTFVAAVKLIKIPSAGRSSCWMRTERNESIGEKKKGQLSSDQQL